MDQPKSFLRPNILIAPLDWGLGHATRCIPIIHTLMRKNCNVLVACEGKTRALLHEEFPQLRFIDLKGYRVHYSKNRWTLPFVIGKQIPKILSIIQYENNRLKDIVKEQDVQGIISDNRYGFYHTGVPSVFITHQLRIRTGLGKLADAYLQKLNYSYINRFSECWIPDGASSPGLAFGLSHPATMPLVPARYLGLLSRFEEKEGGQQKHILILLSGPEPQRTIFENQLVKELAGYREPVVLVRGLPPENKPLQLPPNVIVHDHLGAAALARLFRDASVIISRCGYSTLMDLAVQKKKSILVPTPGQTEQEYLARHLMRTNFALCIRQEKFRLKQALELSKTFRYQLQNFASNEGLNAIIDEFIASLNRA